MLSIFTRNANLVVPSPHIRLGERKGAGLILLLCCVFSVLAVASAQAQGPIPPPGAWSNPITTITGSQTTESVRTDDGATYDIGTNTFPVDRTNNIYEYSCEGGYYTQPGFGFYYGSNTFDLTVTIV